MANQTRHVVLSRPENDSGRDLQRVAMKNLTPEVEVLRTPEWPFVGYLEIYV